MANKLKDFSLNTTLHGVRNLVINRENRFRFILWLVVILAMATWFVYHSVLTIQRYYEFSSYVTTYVKEEETLLFPAVTVCSILSPWVKKEEFEAVTDAEVNKVVNETALKEINLLEYFQKGILDVDQTFFHCHLGNLESLSCKDVVDFTLTVINPCMTFNSFRSKRRLVSKSAGDHEGVVLILDTTIDNHLKREENIIVYGQGFNVNIQSKDDYPSRMSSFFVQPGTTTRVKLRKTITTHLQPPYTEKPCLTKDMKPPYVSMLDYFNRSYSYHGCMVDCISSKAYRQFCDLYGQNNRSCNYYDYFANRDTITHLLLSPNKTQSCGHCLHNCTQTEFHKEVSTAGLGNPPFLTWLQEEFLDRLHNYTIEDIMSKVTVLEIYYESMEVEHKTQQPSVTRSELFCEIGGLLGLCLGASLITLAEFLDFLITYLKDCKKCK